MSVQNGKQPVIGFAGLTHLGINSLVAAAEKGFSVVGFEENEALIQDLKSGTLHVEEPLLSEYASRNFDHITYTSQASDLAACDVVYISTDVPTNDSGESSLDVVNSSIELVLENISSEATLVVLCQVNPGYTRNIKHSHAHIHYQVETLIFGNAMQRALFPERLIVGCLNPKIPLPSPYEIFLNSFNCPILKMKYESAELTKIAINMFLISTVSTTNMLAEVCENIGASWSEIAPALKLDRRIGEYAYLKPGLGISGGNLERDIATINSIAKKHTLSTEVTDSWVSLSQHRKNWVFQQLDRLVEISDNDLIIGVLGLSYKENTHSIKNSPAVELMRRLKSCRIKAYDPVVKEVPIEKIEYMGSLYELLSDIDVLVIMTPWNEFKNISTSDLTKSLRKKILIDPYGLYASVDFEKNGILYCGLGEYAEK